ncbi:MAG TPA: hypothetical protein VHY34_08825 [Caulobacteraceae bacterium]|jgi:hypothetical protein|nr:hypothetical protein [Caulobacteraceae bacterium]
MNMVRKMSQILAVPAMLLGLMSAQQAEATIAPAPPQAAAVGFKTETFATAAFSRSNVDFGLTKGPGFQWYFFNFFGYAPRSNLATLNSGGSITVAALSNNYGNYLASATALTSAPYYRGTAFGGGGYFEATLAYNPAAVKLSTGWPAWWSMSLEHLAGLSTQQWPNQAKSYMHFAEPDFFEADTGSAGSYGGAVHDWYGLYGSASCPSYCNVTMPWTTVLRTLPAGTNVNQYHRYGLLWVRATATTPGSYTYYFDGVQVGKKTTYSLYNNQPPVPTTSTPWTFGVVDKQHLVLILSTGSSTPLNVQSVQVWQASTANNLKY